MSNAEIWRLLQNAKTEEEFDAIVREVERYTVFARDMSRDGCGCIWYGASDTLRVTYRYNQAFHMSVDYNNGVYRPNW